MSSSNAEGGLRRSTRNKQPKDNKGKLQNLVESEGVLSQTKAAAADAQASYIQPGSSKDTGAYTTNQSQSVQSQSKPPYNTQEEQPSPDSMGEAVPDESNDQPMGDAEPERKPLESPRASPRSRYIAENSAESGSPSPVGPNDSSEFSDEVLTDLKKLSIGHDHDGEPDAWSRLGRSNILLVRYGPYKAAKYRVQPGNGYSTQGLQKVSKLKTRISYVMYEGEDGEDHYRYSRDNIVGIVGVAFYERKNIDKVYKTAPPAFVKVKWQGIDAAHQNLLTRGNSWITKADLVRLTDLATAEQKISEAWVKQELDDEDDEDNDLFVDGFSTNAQNASGQDSNGPNNNGLNNDISSGSGQNRPPPKLSKFYKRWLGRVGIPETDFSSLDDKYIARFEAAAYVYMDELRKQGYVVEDDMDMDIGVDI
ncbi:uncharacterized protein N7479_001655 [Penicillium vulpinum]|uniref:uncharacterized protein n=1 Tax=Penicillium vulpinum TaxID=29845 RepID=UPI0025466687|nr:uncharacterized protein N7479_001655 [Penicillium vulpinum]KAJ5971737.1 hypothetical protein N7479_001655 [Penicillium vulpinum]